MPNANNKDWEVMARQAKVADFYLKGLSQNAIAKQMDVCQATISRDLKTIQLEWKESRLVDFDKARAVELERIDKVECEAWGAWDRSQQDAITNKTTDGDEVSKTEHTAKGQYGDPRFLAEVNKCIERRCKLLGLDAPDKHAETDSKGNDLTLDERRDRLRSEVNRLSGRSGDITIGGSPSTN